MTTQDVIQDITQERSKLEASLQNIDYLKAFRSDIPLYSTAILSEVALSDRRSRCFVSRGCGHVTQKMYCIECSS